MSASTFEIKTNWWGKPRKDDSHEIASMLRQWAVMIFPQVTRLSRSLRCKRQQAGWNNDHRESLVDHITAK